jgi:hypothetical protein
MLHSIVAIFARPVLLMANFIKPQMQPLMPHVLCNAAVGGLAGNTVPSAPSQQATREGTAAQTTPLGTATQIPSGISLRSAGTRSLLYLQVTYSSRIMSMHMRCTRAARCANVAFIPQASS